MTSGQRGKNVLGDELVDCSHEPLTGFFRDGCCRTDAQDRGRHVVCAVVTKDFLEYSAARGNDLMTPMPMHGFPGLKDGDRWCLCAVRWQEALAAGVAPPVIAKACHESALEVIDLSDLLRHALDVGQA